MSGALDAPAGAPPEAALDAALDDAGAAPGRRSFWVPGRIEVLGKHTDYAGGRSLLCALERGFTLRSAPRADGQLHVLDIHRAERYSTRVAPDAPPAAEGSWGNYASVVARRLARDFPAARRGADIAFHSSLPADAGLSSSSALVVAIALALIDANQLDTSADYQRVLASREDLAGYLGAVENGRPFAAFPGDAGVGTFGGSEDHTAILCCEADTLSQYAFAPVRREMRVTLDPDVTFVVAVSGITAAKAGAARDRYNRLSVATSQLLERWNARTNRRDATLGAAVTSSRDARDAFVALIDDGEAALRARLEQFIEESTHLVPAAARALADRDYHALGDIVDRSHALAVSALGNQVPETIALQRMARALGAFAASAFGAGFGGSVWALVPTVDAERFARDWERDYRRAHAAAAQASGFFRTRPGRAAHAS